MQPIDHLLNLARDASGMDIAFVTKLHDGVQYFTHLTTGAETFGWHENTAIPASHGYCTHLLEGTIPNIVHDTRIHPVTRHLPSTQHAHIGAYIGVPLTLPDGTLYGALCATSHTPHPTLGAQDTAFLNALARMVGHEISTSTQHADWPTADTIHDYLTGHNTINTVAQPIIDLHTHRIAAVELLSRFDHHPPAAMFTAAHHYGTGIELEHATLNTALTHLPELPTNLPIAINISPDAILSHTLDNTLHKFPLNRLVIELTEHVAFTNIPALRTALDHLRDHGARLAIDDAGSGYAGLQIILALAPDAIKLDISLITGIDKDPVRRALTTALHTFATETNTVIIAEGIQTHNELTTLTTLGIPYGQGNHLHPPTHPHTLTTPTHKQPTHPDVPHA